jgi:hypothetical protein
VPIATVPIQGVIPTCEEILNDLNQRFYVAFIVNGGGSAVTRVVSEDGTIQSFREFRK